MYAENSESRLFFVIQTPCKVISKLVYDSLRQSIVQFIVVERRVKCCPNNIEQTILSWHISLM